MQEDTPTGPVTESGIASKKSTETVRIADRLVEALQLARDEYTLWTEFLQDTADAERDWKRACADGATTPAPVPISPPQKNALLMNLTPAMCVLVAGLLFATV